MDECGVFCAAETEGLATTSFDVVFELDDDVEAFAASTSDFSRLFLTTFTAPAVAIAAAAPASTG